MLTLQDCLDMCDLSPEVVDAIAEHERLPSILAAELGNCLNCSASGQAVIRGILEEGIASASMRGDRRRAERIRGVLVRYSGTPS